MAVHESRSPKPQRGVTLPELLVVVTVVALAVAVAIPLIGGAVRSANARAAANLLSVNLRAARMIAVRNHRTVVFTIEAEPHPRCFCTPTFYEFPGADGRTRRFDMPRLVTIASASAESLEFRPNGSTSGPSTMVIRAEVAADNVELWTIRTQPTGATSIDRSREDR